jgi:hypothetical protein
LEAVAAAALALAAEAASCGGGGVDCSKVMLTVDGSAQVSSLSDAQLADVCDFTACQFGGYNARVFCSTGPAVTVSSGRQQCIDNTSRNPSCTVTVDQLLQCIQAVSQNPCASTLTSNSACSAIFLSSCATIRAGGLTMAAMETSQAP